MPRAVPGLGGATAEQGRPAGHPGAAARALPGEGCDRRRHRLVALRLEQRDPARERRRERRSPSALLPDIESPLLRGRASSHRRGRAAVPAARLAVRPRAGAAPSAALRRRAAAHARHQGARVPRVHLPARGGRQRARPVLLPRVRGQLVREAARGGARAAAGAARAGRGARGVRRRREPQGVARRAR